MYNFGLDIEKEKDIIEVLENAPSKAQHIRDVLKLAKKLDDIGLFAYMNALNQSGMLKTRLIKMYLDELEVY